jgi:hypothetical protein
MIRHYNSNNIRAKFSVSIGIFLIALFFSHTAFAASLSVTPNTGVYSSNSTFTARIAINTNNASINAAEGTLSFNPSELSVVSVNRSGSIFSLWVAEPTFSNSNGTISFSGGVPSGYTGNGTIMNVTFKAKGSGAAKIQFSSGSVLANDGKGTDVLTEMNGGTYTVQAVASNPVAEEVVVEYVAPAYTPSVPKVTSTTHTDQNTWHANKNAVLSWELQEGVTAVRTSLDKNPTAIPTKVYDTPIKTITLDQLDEGVSYFHVQFRNSEGWGKVTHYRLAVDTGKPTIPTLSVVEPDATRPTRQLAIDVSDDTSKVTQFKVQVDETEAFAFSRPTSTSTIPLPVLLPGYHTVVVEAFDEAGNSSIGTISFSVSAFEKPVFTEYPQEVSDQVIPVIKGTTKPRSDVEITLTRIDSAPSVYSVKSTDDGVFTFIPEGRFASGVYEITARASDEFGAQSEISDAIRIAVQQPGLIRFGSLAVSVLSVIIPLIALIVATIFGLLYMVRYIRGFRSRVKSESQEAFDMVHREFANLHTTLKEYQITLQESRKTKKLSRSETDMIEVLHQALLQSQRKVEKEITDVTKL